MGNEELKKALQTGRFTVPFTLCEQAAWDEFYERLLADNEKTCDSKKFCKLGLDVKIGADKKHRFLIGSFFGKAVYQKKLRVLAKPKGHHAQTYEIVEP